MQMSITDLPSKENTTSNNSMAASMAATAMDIRKEKYAKPSNFQSLEHRMESVASSVRGVEFINDSKTTNVNSTWFALESMTKPVILILGVWKANDYGLIRWLR